MDRQTIPPLPWPFHYQIYDAEWAPMQLLELYLFALTGFPKNKKQKNQETANLERVANGQVFQRGRVESGSEKKL